MIKFFRKIRHSLLSEGKTGKYLKYAFGEIVLVVIGILIALQINSWYSKTKDNKLKTVLTENLINNLTKDTIQLNARIKENEDVYLKNLDSIFEIINSPTTTVEDLIILGKTNGVDGLRTMNTYNVSTFNILTSTGNISLFEDSIAEKMMELNRLQDFEISVSKSNRDIYFDLYNSYLRQYIDVNESTNVTLRNEIWANKNATEHASIYINTKKTQKHCVNRYIELSRNVKVKTEELLDLLILKKEK